MFVTEKNNKQTKHETKTSMKWLCTRSIRGRKSRNYYVTLFVKSVAIVDCRLAE